METNSLKKIYDAIAPKYYESRNKHRSDGKHILNEIQNSGKKEISILEFGCGGGRCIKFLNENLKGIKIKYTGVDISKELLKYAQRDNPNDTFICEDICKYILNISPESFDFIIGIASFQHIITKEKRLSLMKNFYKSLKYGGKIIMTNRSFSNRFTKKYKKEILKSIRKYIYTLGDYEWNNIMIPRKIDNKEFLRIYHIFTKKELEKISKEGFFSTKKITYLDKNGEEINNRQNANNTLLVGEKSLQINE